MSILPYIKPLEELKSDIDTYLKSIHNTITTSSPVVQRYLKSHNGIEITGTFSTNDLTPEGRPFYVTVLRQSDKPSIEDGYGFVVLRGDGSTYNIYIVDNNALYGNITFGEVLNTSNINSFISAAKKEIRVDTLYNFKFNIHEDWSTELYISTTQDYGSAVLTTGALSDGPAGYGGKQFQSSETGEWVSMAKGTDIGFGVYKPSGYVWTMKNLEVKKIGEGIPLQLFEIENNGTITEQVQVNYYGSGEVRKNGSISIQGVDLYIARVDDPEEVGFKVFSSWERLGTVDASPDDSLTAKMLKAMTQDEAKWYSFEGKFYIAVLKDFSKNSSELNTAKIVTNYIEVTNGQNKQIINRKAVDVWIDAVDSLEVGSTQVILGTDETVVTLNKPVFLLTKIYTSGNPASNLLDYTGLTGICPKPVLNGLEYSSRENITLLNPNHSGSTVTIEYLHAKTITDSIQTLVTNNKYRSPGSDPIIRINPPVLVEISNLSFKGNISAADLKSRIINFIISRGYTSTLSKSDIVSFLYSNGVTYINLLSLEVNLHVFDYYLGWKETVPLTDSYTLPTTPCRWYTYSDIVSIVQA